MAKRPHGREHDEAVREDERVTTSAPATKDTVVLSYSYEAQSGQPPNGKAYHSSGSLSLLAISYTDADGVDQTNFLSQVAVTDQITCNGVTWTVGGVQLRGSNILFTIDPPQAAPPYGPTQFTFGALAPPDSAEDTLIGQINAAMDIYSQTHGFEGPNARNLLIHLITAEVGSRGHAAKARKAEDHRSRER